eukprot:3727057-Pleurochrysis_carterae.AAC.1
MACLKQPVRRLRGCMLVSKLAYSKKIDSLLPSSLRPRSGSKPHLFAALLHAELEFNIRLKARASHVL